MAKPFLTNQKFAKANFSVHAQEPPDAVNDSHIPPFSEWWFLTFIDKYLIHEKNKTLTVRLRRNVEYYSNKFLRGFLLGLMISDGCMKNKFVFTTISEKLAKNVEEILNIVGYKSHHYVQKNRNWKDVHRITLTKNESCNILKFLDNALTECNSRDNFSQLKYGPTAI